MDMPDMQEVRLVLVLTCGDYLSLTAGLERRGVLLIGLFSFLRRN
jgi:hypothetical protein